MNKNPTIVNQQKNERTIQRKKIPKGAIKINYKVR